MTFYSYLRIFIIAEFLIVNTIATVSSYRTVYADSVASLQKAIFDFLPFDEIILVNGIYIDCTLKISSVYDITIRSETDGGVTFTGSVSITVSGSRITFRGFQFINGTSPKDIINVFSSYSLFTQLNFYAFNANKYINFEAGCQYNVLSYSNFAAKPANAPINNLVGVLLDGSNPAFHVIQFCSFQNMLGNGGDNGNVAIRLGLGSMSTFSSSTVVEFCVFQITATITGDSSESVSVESRDNILRYNTFTNQQGAMLSFRNGDNNYAYSNFFINAGGIRVKQASNLWIYNNYFHNSGTKDNTITLDDVSAFPNHEQYQQNISMLYNTIIDGNGIDLGITSSKTGGLWSGNLFLLSTTNIFKTSGSVADIVFHENQYKGSLGISAVPVGLTQSDTIDLIPNQHQYFSLSAGSSARKGGNRKHIGTISPVPGVVADYSLSLDIAGCKRPSSGKLDLGSNQYKCNLATAAAATTTTKTKTTVNRPLSLNDVGPIYKRKLSTATNLRKENRNHNNFNHYNKNRNHN